MQQRMELKKGEGTEGDVREETLYPFLSPREDWPDYLMWPAKCCVTVLLYFVLLLPHSAKWAEAQCLCKKYTKKQTTIHQPIITVNPSMAPPKTKLLFSGLQKQTKINLSGLLSDTCHSLQWWDVTKYMYSSTKLTKVQIQSIYTLLKYFHCRF